MDVHYQDSYHVQPGTYTGGGHRYLAPPELYRGDNPMVICPMWRWSLPPLKKLYRLPPKRLWKEEEKIIMQGWGQKILDWNFLRCANYLQILVKGSNHIRGDQKNRVANYLPPLTEIWNTPLRSPLTRPMRTNPFSAWKIFDNISFILLEFRKSGRTS